MVEIGKDVDIIFDTEDKIFAVINTNLNLSIAVNGKFVLILNITSGNYLLIDINTQYAIIGSIQIDFLLSGGGINYTKFVVDVNVVFSKYTSITSSTSGSFNFGLIIAAFYAGNFNLVSIVGQTIAGQLSASFGIWLQLVRTAIVNGSLTLSNGIWGFLAIVIDIDITIAVAIFEVIRVSVEVFHEVSVQIIVALVSRIQQNIQSVISFAFKIGSYISITGNANINSLIAYLNNATNNPVSFNVTLGGSSFALLVVRVDGQYVIQLTTASGSIQQLNIQFIFAGDVLIIYNLRTNIAIALYRRYLLVVNATAEIGLLYTWQLFTGIKVGVVNTASLSADLRASLFAKVAADVKAIINSNGSSLTTSWSALYRAVVSGSVTAVGGLVGSGNASAVITFYGSFVASTSGSISVGAIATAVFSAGVSGLSIWIRALITIFSALITTLANTTQSWITIISTLTGSGSITISG